MGVGKTTIGQRLAQRLGWTFRDLDDWIEERNGCTVADLFKHRGEPYFRAEEKRAAEAVRGLTHHVIAAGGGAFAQPETRAVLRDGAAIVWLTCDLASILQRVAMDGSRPLAADRERMQALLAQRTESYRMADLGVDTTEASPEEVAATIVDALFPAPDQKEPR
jgi:shikimate kinase